MSKIFLQLPRDEQSKILRALGPALSRALHDDFRRMVDAGMFIGAPPSFDHIVERLRALEATINR